MSIKKIEWRVHFQYDTFRFDSEEELFRALNSLEIEKVEYIESERIRTITEEIDFLRQKKAEGK